MAPKPPLVRGGKAPAAVPTQAPAPAGRGKKRGQRQGDLSATQPQRPNLPSADFVKPNPLDSDVIMDATARLLAPRSTRLYAQPAPQEARRAEEPAPASGNSRRRRHRHGGKGKALEQPAHRAAPAPQPKSQRPGRTPHRTFPPERPQRGHRDSTETPGSVMKPYYLSDD